MTKSENKGVAIFGRRECYGGMSKTENAIRIMKPSYNNIKFKIGEVLNDYKTSEDDWVLESLKAAGYMGIKRNKTK
jgi:hypothetical protein